MSIPTDSEAAQIRLSDQVLDAAPIGMALTAPDGTTLWANASWGRLAGVDPAAPPTPLHELVGREDAAADDELVAGMVAGRITSGSTQQLWRRPDGSESVVVVRSSLAVEESGRRLELGEPPVPVVVRQATDVTETVEAKEAAARALADLELRNAELERSNAELAEFAYVVSHDLSEPLRVISGHVSLLSRAYTGQLDEQADQWIHFAVDGCERMRALIDDLLSYSRAGREEPAPRSVDTGELVDAALRGLRSAIDETGAVVEVGELPTVHGDASQLAQVVSNLLANAIKFHRTDHAPAVRVSGHAGPDSVTLEVADNGIGIPERHRERVFGVFQRLQGRDEYPGTGIGLAVCRKIVLRHGGTIEIDDNDEGGTTVRVTLPDPAKGDPP